MEQVLAVIKPCASPQTMAKLLLLSTTCYALVPPLLQPTTTKLRAATLEEVERIPTPAFGKTFGDDISKLKAAIFHYGATLDRGQGFNPSEISPRGGELQSVRTRACLL